MKETSLFTNIKFWPLFWTQFCGAFNDNIFKIALVLVILGKGSSYSLWGMPPNILQSVALAVFILPFFLFSATAGQIADKYDKASLIRKIKVVEIIIMSLGLYGFLTDNIGFLVIVLFLMGTQSTFFGPLKYSLLPQHLPATALTAANGLIEMATFLAILLGTILGGILLSVNSNGLIMVSSTVVVVALLGWLFSRKIPDAASSDPTQKINYNFITETHKQISFAYGYGKLIIVIFGISWFWYLGAALLTILGPMSQSEMHGSKNIFTLLITFLSIGIGVGSVLCDKLIVGKSSNHLVVIGALGITLVGIELYFAAQSMIDISPQLLDAVENKRQVMSLVSFFSHFNGYRLVFDLLIFGVFSGFFIVPLFVILQLRSEEAHRSRMIAVNNIINSLFMVITAVVIVVLTKAGINSPQIILINSLFNIIVIGLMFWKMPEFMQDFLSFLKFKSKSNA